MSIFITCEEVEDFAGRAGLGLDEIVRLSACEVMLCQRTPKEIAGQLSQFAGDLQIRNAGYTDDGYGNDLIAINVSKGAPK